MSDNYSSPYICHCTKNNAKRGICIIWEDNKVSGYDCHYPNCQRDCDMLQDYPMGFIRPYPSKIQN